MLGVEGLDGVRTFYLSCGRFSKLKKRVSLATAPVWVS